MSRSVLCEFWVSRGGGANCKHRIVEATYEAGEAYHSIERLDQDCMGQDRWTALPGDPERNQDIAAYVAAAIKAERGKQ